MQLTNAMTDWEEGQSMGGQSAQSAAHVQSGAMTQGCCRGGVLTQRGGLTALREEMGSDGSRAESRGDGRRPPPQLGAHV